MSVLKPQRSLSETQFLTTAKELAVETMRQCAKFPKRYTFSLRNCIEVSALKVVSDVKKGNSIYPGNQHEAQIRRDLFVDAVAELQSIIYLMEISEDTIGIDKDAMQKWIEIVYRENNLLKALLKSDKARFKDLP